MRRKNPTILRSILILACTAQEQRELGAYRRSEPVSSGTLNVCPPIVIDVKYAASKSDGEASTAPLLAAAAVLKVEGTIELSR